MNPMFVVLAGGAAGILLTLVYVVFFSCKHDWEPVVERELPSRVEIAKLAGEDIKTWPDAHLIAESSSKMFFAIISCKKCGAVKKYIVES